MLPVFQTTFRVPLVDSREPDSTAYVSLNGTWIQCSLTVLRILSPKLLALYSSRSRISIEEEVVGEMINLLSTGQIEVTAENLERLTYVAHQHDMPSLHKFCECLYLSHLSPGRSLYLWLLAMDKGLRRLQRQALKLVQEHFESISQTESFCYIGKSQVETVILDPPITRIESVYKAIQHWSQYRSEEDLRAQAKDELICAYNQKLGIAEHDHRWVHLPLSNESMEHGSMNSFHKSPDQCPSSRPARDSRRVSESNNCPEMIWIAKSGSKELSVFEICLENGNISPVWHNVSFPKRMEDVSAFWYCAKANRIYASDEENTWRLSRDGHNWRKCSNLPSGRRHHMLCSVGDTLYALGGYDYQSIHLTEYVLKYNMNKNSWTDFHHAGKLHRRVQSGKCVAIDNDIFIFGGFNPDDQGNLVETRTAQRYDAVTKTSDKLADLPFDPSKHGAVSCAVTDGENIYIFSSVGQVVSYNPVSNNYMFLASYPTPRTRFGAFIDDEMLYIFGGQNRSNSVHDIHCLDLREPNSDWQHYGMLNTPMIILSNS